jgi:hypothetical protein
MHSLICSILRGERVRWPEDADAGAFLALAQEHGAQPLLYYSLRQSGMLAEWPQPIADALKAELVRQVTRDLLSERELPRVLEALASAGVQPLLLKGTPLSVTHYPEAGLRPRTDTDLLIDREQLPALEAALVPLGYAAANAVSGDLVSHQRMYEGRLTLDVHWKLFNPALLAGLLPLQELRERAVAVPQLGPRARALCPAHALLHACIHRAGHHALQSDRLIWLYDIHLLAQAMNAAEFEDFARIAADIGVRTLCLAGLEAARGCFHTNVFEDIARRLLHVPAAASEPSALFLRPGLSRLDLWKSDFRHLRGRDRLRLVREHLLPPAGYMLRKYNTTSRLALPALYIRRALSGAWRLLRDR